MEPSAPWRSFYGEVKESLDYPKTTIWESLHRIACKYPQNTALVYMNRKITYKEMIKRIIDVQAGFEKCGVKKGDRVAVCLPNIPQAVYCLYALNRMGAIACFVHPLSSPNEIEAYTKLADSKLIVMLSTQAEAVIKGEKAVGKALLLTTPVDELGCIEKFFSRAHRSKKLENKAELKIFHWQSVMKKTEQINVKQAVLSAQEPAVVLFSGGTTGVPKGVLISSFGLNAMAVQTVCMSNCQVLGRTMLGAMPVFHGFGLGVCIHTVLIHGGCCILIPRFSAEEYGKLIKKYRPNFIAGVPTLFEAVIHSKSLSGVDLSCLKGVFSGGDVLRTELKEKFDGYLKEHGATVKIREGYGLTECVTASCLTPYNAERKGSIGIPFPDTFYKICKVNTTEELPCGATGEICITGPALMLGYLNNEEETKSALRVHADGRTWLHTGDAGMMDKDGFVYFKYRLKRLIVTSGYNVYPAQVEEVLCTHPAVKLCCAVGVRDSYKMQRVKAFVVLNTSDAEEEKLRTELMAYCRTQLARFAVPSQIEFVPKLPLTKLGKVDYQSLEVT